MKLDGAHVPALIDDLEAAVREAKAAFGTESGGWTRAPAGKWTAGQHLAHVGLALGLSADRFEEALAAHEASTLGPRPWRDPIQALAMRVLTGERFPRGAKTPSVCEPGPTASREQTFARIDQGATRLRAVAERVLAADRERVWIWNPYAPRLKWHYTLPEILRVQASHVRHHTRMALEAAGS